MSAFYFVWLCFQPCWPSKRRPLTSLLKVEADHTWNPTRGPHGQAPPVTSSLSASCCGWADFLAVSYPSVCGAMEDCGGEIWMIQLQWGHGQSFLILPGDAMWWMVRHSSSLAPPTGRGPGGTAVEWLVLLMHEEMVNICWEARGQSGRWEYRLRTLALCALWTTKRINSDSDGNDDKLRHPNGLRFHAVTEQKQSKRQNKKKPLEFWFRSLLGILCRRICTWMEIISCYGWQVWGRAWRLPLKSRRRLPATRNPKALVLVRSPLAGQSPSLRVS